MDAEGKVYINEVHPLQATGSANIYLNTKSTKVKSHDGTAIHLKADKQTDLGVHINTTFSIASSKKLKFLFVLNFSLSLVCMVVCFAIACYYWHEISALRRQLDTIKDNFLIQNTNPERLLQSMLVRQPSQPRPEESRESREARARFELSENTKRLFVEELGEHDMLLVDSKKKNNTPEKPNTESLVASVQKEMLVAHFSGAITELIMREPTEIGPWALDKSMSSKDNVDKMNVNGNHIVIKEGGVYFVYVQITYRSRASNCYHIWAQLPGERARLLASCATGNDSSERPLDKAQISCNTQTVARLQPGEIIKVVQREPNRTFILLPGYSYVGFVKLSS